MHSSLREGYRADRELALSCRSSRSQDESNLLQDLGAGAKVRPMFEAINIVEYVVQRDKKRSNDQLVFRSRAVCV